ncbi:MAG: hypothetical protein NZ653_01030 [Anaerolineae bacterium]|nr:hypothetical protein [Anaerolineae bacterium]
MVSILILPYKLSSYKHFEAVRTPAREIFHFRKLRANMVPGLFRERVANRILLVQALNSYADESC